MRKNQRVLCSTTEAALFNIPWTCSSFLHALTNYVLTNYSRCGIHVDQYSQCAVRGMLSDVQLLEVGMTTTHWDYSFQWMEVRQECVMTSFHCNEDDVIVSPWCLTSSHYNIRPSRLCCGLTFVEITSNHWLVFRRSWGRTLGNSVHILPLSQRLVSQFGEMSPVRFSVTWCCCSCPKLLVNII